MTTPTLTPWFPISTPPVRKGVYNVSCRSKFQSGAWFAYWDGKRFGWYGKTANDGEPSTFCDCVDFTKSWRGIAK